MTMLCRQLSKRDLRTVWIAAYFPKRLGKDLVEETNITSSVDEILVDQLPSVTYRILGLLLLGVTRIYSKKVEYLLLDCKKSADEVRCLLEESRRTSINVEAIMSSLETSTQMQENTSLCVPESSSTKARYAFLDPMRAQFSSISLPENFQLDAFELEAEEICSHDAHVKPNSELMLDAARENNRIWNQISGKGCLDIFAQFADHASAFAMITNTSTDANDLEMSPENLRFGSYLEGCMDPMILSEVMVSEGKNMGEDENEGRNDQHHDQEWVTGETMVSEMTLVDNVMLEKHHLSVTIDQTPQSKAPLVSGDSNALNTPASKALLESPQKRKCNYDEETVVPSATFEAWLGNTSSLVRRRKRRLSNLLAWKINRFSNLARSLIDPIIPIKSDIADLRAAIFSNEALRVETVQDKTDELGTLDMRNTSEGEGSETIDPLSPVTQLTSSTFSKTHELSKGNEGASRSSFEI